MDHTATNSPELKDVDKLNDKLSLDAPEDYAPARLAELEQPERHTYNRTTKM